MADPVLQLLLVLGAFPAAHLALHLAKRSAEKRKGADPASGAAAADDNAYLAQIRPAYLSKRELGMFVGFVGMMCLLTGGFFVYSKPPNYFEVLGIPPGRLSGRGVKLAYSIKKREFEKAGLETAELDAAYSILSSRDMARTYYRLGDLGVRLETEDDAEEEKVKRKKEQDDPEKEEEKRQSRKQNRQIRMLLAEGAATYAVWFVVIYVTSSMREARGARARGVLALIALFVAESAMKVFNANTESGVLGAFGMLPWLTACEKADMLRVMLAPAYASMLWYAIFTYFDHDMWLLGHYQMLRESNQILLDEAYRALREMRRKRWQQQKQKEGEEGEGGEIEGAPSEEGEQAVVDAMLQRMGDGLSKTASLHQLEQHLFTLDQTYQRFVNAIGGELSSHERLLGPGAWDRRVVRQFLREERKLAKGIELSGNEADEESEDEEGEGGEDDDEAEAEAEVEGEGAGAGAGAGAVEEAPPSEGVTQPPPQAKRGKGGGARRRKGGR